jgi:multiple sugar transport system substrate-binding protein
MHEKAKDLVQAFTNGRIGRRDLFRQMGKLGVGAAAANYLYARSATEALAADFDWEKYKGKTVTLLLNKHPYADAMIADVDTFKKLTGMDVKYDVFPEDVYFDKVTAALSSRSTTYDAFMTGAYQTWQYGPAG